MPAPKTPNTAAATAAVRRKGEETMAAKLRARGWTCTPPKGDGTEALIESAWRLGYAAAKDEQETDVQNAGDGTEPGGGDMEESVTRALTAEYVEQGESSTEGVWHRVSLRDLGRAGWTHVAFHYPDEQETPNAVILSGETAQGDSAEVPVTVSVTEIVDGAEVPIREPKETTISRGALDLMHGNGPLGDRRQRAREAGLDAYSDVLAVPSGPERAAQAIDDAIETATRVQLSEDVIAAAVEFTAAPGSTKGVYRMLAAAFAAAGFEVEE